MEWVGLDHYACSALDSIAKEGRWSSVAITMVRAAPNVIRNCRSICTIDILGMFTCTITFVLQASNRITSANSDHLYHLNQISWWR